MKSIAILSFCLLFLSLAIGQNPSSPAAEKLKGNSVYFVYENQKLEYFAPHDKSADKGEAADSMVFSMKNGNHANIYMKWLNPLKYRLMWKDTSYVDERDKIINEFVLQLVAQFAGQIPGFKKSAGAENGMASEGRIIWVPQNGFYDTELNLLYLQLQYSDLSHDDIPKLREITNLVSELDSMAARNIPLELDYMFMDMLSIGNYMEVPKRVGEYEKNLADYAEYFKAAAERVDAVTSAMKSFDIKDKLLLNYFRAVISSFIQKTNSTIDSQTLLVGKLQPVVDILKNSVKDEAPDTPTKGYFRVKHIGFDEGEKLRSNLSLTEFEYKVKTKEFVKKKELLSKTMVFQKHDFFNVFVSAGLFYSSTTLRGYGVSNNGTNFTVTESYITKSNPVVATFLNFQFGTGSRYLAPLAQIGIDPTKKRPYLLLGAGFLIPTARFAFTGGPVWTWNQTLDKLKVGQTISTTTELEDDINYEFDMKPKGWYLGVQYKF